MIIGTKSTANPAHKTKRIRPCTNSGFRRISIFNCADAPRIHIYSVLFEAIIRWTRIRFVRKFWFAPC